LGKGRQGQEQEQIPPAPLFQRGEQQCTATHGLPRGCFPDRGIPQWSRFFRMDPGDTRSNRGVERRAPPFEKGGQGGFAFRAAPHAQSGTRRCLTSESTTDGSARVLVSPSWSGAFSAILRRMRRMILP